MKKTEISVVIPAYNEENSIATTVKSLFSLGLENNWDIEVIVVNDGSRDNTGKIALETGATIINHPINGGYGLSIQDGIEASKMPLIAITDADGTYPISELPNLLKMVTEDGFDMAVGARTGSEYKKGLWKYPARLAFKWLSEFVAGRRIPDINSGLRVMKKDKLLPHYKRTCLGFSFTTSITLIFFLNGYFVGYKPIPYAKRVGKSKVRHFQDSLRTAQILVSVISYYNPLKLYLLLAIFNIFTGIIILLVGESFSVYGLVMFGAVLLGTAPFIMSLGFLAESIRLKN
jgi:glycosyltransferase involved in cell wall biosynthesis